MIPFLLHPLALLGLVALPLLTAIYIFRSRFRPRPVSSLILWRFLDQPRLGGARRERLQLPWLFFLELLVVLLLVVAAAGPQLKLAQYQRPLVVVLDDSVSMRAEAGGTTAQARARAFLEDLVHRKRPPLVRFVLAGTRPQVLESQAHAPGELGGALEQWRCSAPAAALDQALALAGELGRGRADLLVLTDHAPPDGLPRTERLVWVAFGQPAANAGIVNASRTPYADQDRCMLEVFNGSSSNLTTTLTVRAGTNLLLTERVSLEPRASRRFVFTVPGTTPALHAELVPDALAEDNYVQLLPSLRKRVRVRVAVTNPELAGLIERTLDATGLRASPGAAPELVIYEGTGTVRGEDLWTLRVVRGDSPALYTGPFLIDAAHPLGRGLALLGTVWAATALSNRPGEVPVIMAGNVPLLTVFRDARGNQHVTLNFDHAHSTVQSSADWPVLFWNLLHWRAMSLPGPQQNNVRLGSELIVTTGGRPVSVTHPDGTTVSINTPGVQTVLDLPMPGLYTITLEQQAVHVAVNLLAQEESDLSGCATGRWGRWVEPVEATLGVRGVGWLLALVALAGLVLHSYALATGKGG